ncbi:MAG: ThiF family adenylyltransferase [Caldilineaceae bacterium]|nr:ThiF family adenylyltransferase [Caldilineaceae bacterium]MCB9140496.1 ThiF family adenylyltransferase [Caldilineaceae bacterium]
MNTPISSATPVRLRSQALAPRNGNELPPSARANLVPGYEQAALQACRLLLVGAGGIGGEIALTLVRKGIGELHIVDPDVVELSNLNRQRFFRDDLDQPKATALAFNLLREATDTTVLTGTPETVEEILGSGSPPAFDVAVCGVDNDATRAFCARYCRTHGVPCIFVAVSRDAGQGYVFVQEATPEAACWLCLHPDAGDKAPNPCPAGATPDILKVVAGLATYAIDTLIMERQRRWNYKEVFLAGEIPDGHRQISRNSACPLCGHAIDM